MPVQIPTLPQVLVHMDGILLQEVLIVLNDLQEAAVQMSMEQQQVVRMENTQWLDGLNESNDQLDIYVLVRVHFQLLFL